MPPSSALEVRATERFAYGYTDPRAVYSDSRIYLSTQHMYDNQCLRMGPVPRCVILQDGTRLLPLVL